MNKILGLVIVSFIIGTPLAHCASEKEPVDYVDVMLGTSDSRWMLYPGPSMPFSMVKLSPDNGTFSDNCRNFLFITCGGDKRRLLFTLKLIRMNKIKIEITFNIH